jgi:hypothetical protein
MITLTAFANAGSVFAGWSGGGCTGTGACVVTVAASTTVSATFNTTAVQASVIGVKTFSSPTRFTRVIVSSDQPVKVSCRVVRNGATLTSKQVLNVVGDKTIKLPYPRSVTPGSAQLKVTFTNAAGSTKTVTRTVRVPQAS